MLCIYIECLYSLGLDVVWVKVEKLVECLVKEYGV